LRRTCTAANPEHKHIWTLGAIPGLLDDFICIAPPYPAKYHNSWEVCYHPCFGKEPGDIIVYPNALDNLSIIEYFNCSFWYYLDSTVFINYDQFGNNPLTTYKKFFYDNERHIQLTRTIEKDGKGNIIQAQFRYPQDYNEIENFAHLIDANIISSPIVEEEYYNSKIVSGKINKYNDEGQLIEISQYENENLIDKPKHDPDVITTIPEFYQKKIDIQYDPGNHKMIQQQPTNNIITSYIWGYNFTQVVAKIENADFYTVLQVMQIPIEGIQNMNDNELQTVFNNLRENMPNAMITSYTYKSGVGMTSETDPAGKTTYYEYDNFARLKFIKDKDGNIIKRYRYHFKNQ
jgi:YD repeat-containing protein